MTLHPSTAWHSRWDRIGYIFDDHAHAPAPTRELLMVPRWSMGPTSISVQQSVNLRSTDAASGPKQCAAVRSEEHTSELQSLMRISYAVFCLKKKNTNTTNIIF